MTSALADRISFAAVVENLPSGRDFLRRYVDASGWPGSDLDVVIAVGEVLQNIVRHGFGGDCYAGTITINVAVENGVLIVIIDDTAPPSCPTEWANTDRQRHEGGIGMGIIARIASTVSFQPTNRGNRATLQFMPE